MRKTAPRRNTGGHTTSQVLRTTLAALPIGAAGVILFFFFLSMLLASCAVMEAPPGGPIDTEPPYVSFVIPDSAMTDVGPIKKLTITFSEKMDRQPATSWLHFFPDQRIRKTRWKGATTAEIELEEPLPADTTVVIEIAGGMRDAHRVANKAARRYPVATGPALARGTLSGKLMLEDEALKSGIVELYPLQPDTLEYFQRPLARRTQTDEMGQFRFEWLPVPGGPWVARAFESADGSLRPGDRSPQRLLPDTLSISQDEPSSSAGTTIIYRPTTPGQLVAGPFAPHPRFEGPIMAFTMVITDADTGYYAAPLRAGQTDFSILLPDSGGIVQPVKPGHVRLVAFVDVDADSTFSSVPDTLLGAEVAARTDTVAWYMEPWALLEGIDVPPGLPADFVMPAWPDTLVLGPKPLELPTPVGLDDTLSVDLPDSLNLQPNPDGK
jgi:hypothetical protein